MGDISVEDGPIDSRKLAVSRNANDNSRVTAQEVALAA